METVKYRGINIEIEQDQDAQSPQEWSDDERILVYNHRDFYVKKKGFDPDEIFEEVWHGNKFYKGYFAFGVDAYIHSGVVLAIKDTRKALDFPDRRWDVSFKGFALIRKEKGTWDRTKAFEIAEGLVDIWNQYLSGDVYGYNIEQFNDSYWGYYGYDTCLEEAKLIVDYHLEQNRKKRIVTLKQLIKSKVPLEYRQKQLLTLSLTNN